MFYIKGKKGKSFIEVPFVYTSQCDKHDCRKFGINLNNNKTSVIYYTKHVPAEFIGDCADLGDTKQLLEVKLHNK